MHSSVGLPLFVDNTHTPVYVCGYVNSAVNTSTRLCRAEWLIKPSDHPICITHIRMYISSIQADAACVASSPIPQLLLFSQTPCTQALRLICILTHRGRISLKRGSAAFTLLTNQASNATYGSCCGADKTKIVSRVCVCWRCLFWVRCWLDGGCFGAQTRLRFDRLVKHFIYTRVANLTCIYFILLVLLISSRKII